jgi:molybdate transport system substrate-binding protein
VTVATGASGSLTAQIRNGAPYDVFLSADLAYPRSLIESGDAEGRTLKPFANGQLVLWTTRRDLELTSIPALIGDKSVRKIALANPATAPYGRAAQEALEHMDLWKTAPARLVFGENIAQTAQFVATGNADAGFVALSLVLSSQLKQRGQWIAVPTSSYAPISQGAILTRRGAANPTARRYLEFLSSDEARVILEHFGYLVPVSALPEKQGGK